MHPTPRHDAQCVGILAEALGARWLPYAKQLLEPIVLTGLSDTLVASLRKVGGRSWLKRAQGCLPLLLCDRR